MWKIDFSKECLSSILWHQQNDSLPIFKLNLKSKKNQRTQGSEWQWKTFQMNLPKTLVLGFCSGMAAQFCSHTSKASNINEIAMLKKKTTLGKKIRISFPVLWTLLRSKPCTAYIKEKSKSSQEGHDFTLYLLEYQIVPWNPIWLFLSFQPRNKVTVKMCIRWGEFPPILRHNLLSNTAVSCCL